MMQPPDRVAHCPFLNRTDPRCGSHFTLERMEHAFAYCFDRYSECPVYSDLLVERRVRRGEADRLATLTISARPRITVDAPAESASAEPVGPSNALSDPEPSYALRSFAQITVRAKRLSRLRAAGLVFPKRAA
jgi:hypothetical protein